MNIHLDKVFNTVIQNNCESIPFILYYVSLDLEAVHIQMEDTNQDIQDATSDYIDNTYTPKANPLDTSVDTINYIEEFNHSLYSYPEFPTTQDHITPNIKTELRAPTDVADTFSRQMKAVLQIHCKILLKSYPIFNPRIQLNIQGKIIPNLKIII